MRRRRAERRRPGAARQRGAIGVLGAMTLLQALLFTALAVDSGRLWMEKRGLQHTADIAAIEAARFVGCGGSLESAEAAAEGAAVNNAYRAAEPATPIAVDFGTLSSPGGTRQFTPGASEAVRVSMTRTVPASLVLGGLFGATVTMRASAVATGSPPMAAFSAGSSLLTLSTGDSKLLNGLLGGLLGSNLNLSLASYQGIAATNVNLLQLVQASATAGSVKELLTTDMSVADALHLAASAVARSGTADAGVAAAGLDELAAKASGINVRLGDVLAVATPDSEAAANAAINLLDLVSTTLMVANGQHAIDLNLGIPGVAAVKLTVIEPPQIAIGSAGRAADGSWCAEARTAQVKLSAKVLGLSTVNLQLATGNAHLTSLDVGPETTARIGAQAGLAKADLLGIPILSLPGAETTLDFGVPLPVADTLPMRQSTSASATLLGGVLDPLLKLLGIQLGAVDVKLMDIRHAQPKLVI